MCFTADPKITKRLRREMRTDRVPFYKVTNAAGDSIHAGGGLMGPKKHYEVDAEVSADKRARRVRTTKRDMTAGIYVYRYLPRPAFEQRVFVVLAHPDSLIGADEKLACFHSVRVVSELRFTQPS